MPSVAEVDKVKLRKAKSGEVAKARERGEPCPLCGEHHIKANGKYMCVGHNTRGKPCGLPPIPGGTNCKPRHGGGVPDTQRAAARRLAFAETEGEVAKLLRQVDLPDQHPIDGLIEVVRHTGGMMRMLGQLVSGLDVEPATTWRTEFGPGDSSKQILTQTNYALTALTHEGDAVADVRVVLYERWAGLYMRACKLALDADIDERLVRNATATSDGFFKALNVGLSAAKMNPEQQIAFTNAMAKELRKMGNGIGEVIDG